MEYLFRRTQRRSVDLKYRPWTRYIETYANLAQAQQAFGFTNDASATLQGIFLNTPGINTLTPKVVVTPGFNFTANFALTMAQCCPCGFDGEVGYNFYAKQAECVDLKDPFVTEAAIKDHVGFGITNPIRNITQNRITNEASIWNLNGNGSTGPDAIFAAYPLAIIKESDLDLASASHPCAQSHLAYASLGYHWDDLCHPLMTSVGVSYEFTGQSNAALNRWLLWGRFGVSF